MAKNIINKIKEKIQDMDNLEIIGVLNGIILVIVTVVAFF